MGASPSLAVRRPVPIRVSGGRAPGRVQTRGTLAGARVERRARAAGVPAGLLAVAGLAAAAALAAGVVANGPPARGAASIAATGSPAGVVRGGSAASVEARAAASGAIDLSIDDDPDVEERVVVVPDEELADAQLETIAALARGLRDGTTLVAEPCGRPSPSELERLGGTLARALGALGVRSWTLSPLLGGCVLEGGVVLRPQG